MTTRRTCPFDSFEDVYIAFIPFHGLPIVIFNGRRADHQSRELHDCLLFDTGPSENREKEFISLFSQSLTSKMHHLVFGLSNEVMPFAFGGQMRKKKW